jgi:hypothetical protein
MGDAETGEGFKVTDRRRRPPEEPGDASRVSVHEAPGPRADRPRQPGPGEASAIGSRPPHAGTQRERSLVGLFLSLGSTAVVGLGAPDPATGERRVDLAQAGEVIDLLMLLRERTEGHRTAQETRVLEDLLYDLQLRYVEVKRQSG